MLKLKTTFFYSFSLSLALVFCFCCLLVLVITKFMNILYAYQKTELPLRCACSVYVFAVAVVVNIAVERALFSSRFGAGFPFLLPPLLLLLFNKDWIKFYRSLLSARNHLYDNIANDAHKILKRRRKRSPLTTRPKARASTKCNFKAKIQNYTHTHSIHCSATTKVFQMLRAPSMGYIIFSLAMAMAIKTEKKQKKTCNIYYSQIVRVVRVLKNENSYPITTTGDTPKGCYKFHNQIVLWRISFISFFVSALASVLCTHSTHSFFCSCNYITHNLK